MEDYLISSTPKHSRQSSHIDYVTKSHSRTQSRNSFYGVSTPSGAISNSSNEPSGIEIFGSGGLLPQTKGSSNLADELADAWDEGEGEDDGSEFDLEIDQQEDQLHPSRDSGVDVSSPTNSSRVTTAPQVSGKESRRQSTEYEGEDYGDNITLDVESTPAGLLAKMDLVESLVRRGTENNGTDRDEVVKRVIEELKDLGAQSRVEGGAARLITAHSALSTHLMHQTRVLQSLTYPLFSPLTLPPDEDFINDLLPLLVQTSELIPRPSTAAFNSLTQLHSLTADIIQNLNFLSDTLHMSRQTTTTASRRLRSARELVAEMRKEEEAREEGENWLQRHNWSDRLHNRECARVCGDVLGGFDEVCNGWRARLVAQMEVVDEKGTKDEAPETTTSATSRKQ